MVLIFPFLFRFVCFRCLIRPFISSKVEEILKFSVSSLIFYPPNRLFLSYLNVVTCVNGILHKRLVCYTSYFFLGCLLGFAPKESDIKRIYSSKEYYLLGFSGCAVCCLLGCHVRHDYDNTANNYILCSPVDHSIQL